MKPKPGDKLYYDEILSRTLKTTEHGKKTGLIDNNFIYNHLASSKVFWIDEMLLDNFHNVSHGNMNYEKAIKLPFPSIFFEFEKGIDVVFPKGKKTLKAILHSDFETTHSIFTEGNSEDISDSRQSYLFFDDKRLTWPVEFLNYNLRELPDFVYSSVDGTYMFEGNKVSELNLKDKNTFSPIRSDYDSNQFSKLIDLTLNLISYINAQNVIIKQSDSDRKKIGKINKKRRKKGKSEIAKPSPYYWAEVRKSYVYSERDRPKEKEWELEHRVWNRGHFRHYKDGRCTWIIPYIKGPENAPWKENRYANLYKNFKHLLASRENEKI
jgi:hypothetical protein